jgi:SAM-dependent methyltransferase
MTSWDYETPYREHVRRLIDSHDGENEAMAAAVGGEFAAVGAIERDLLVQWGLRDDAYLVDVGCGSGRLAQPLDQGGFAGRYLGTDVVPELLAHARKSIDRPDWRFELADGLAIPEADEQVDMVAFFSVFTHLLHEHSYVYLREARRVLKPGGRVVFSFLEFAVAGHWPVFDARAEGGQWAAGSLDMFMSRDAIGAWAEHLDLRVLALERGDTAHIPLSHPVVFDDGTVVEGTGALGQSVCVLEKP